MKHFINITDASLDELGHLFDVAFELRQQRDSASRPTPLARKTLAIILEKPSLRTRVSFEQAMYELGGQAMALGQHEIGLGKRESAADVVRVLEGMVHGVAARVFEHQKLIDMASHSDMPIINALSDYSHPCQALADAMTIMDEFGRDLKGRTVAFIGDGNNVARSLANLCAKLGMHFTLAAPKGYELESSFVDGLVASTPGMKFQTLADPMEAARTADVLYTDTWISMGQEDEAAHRKQVFASYQINERMLQVAPAHAIVLHCLPAYRGLEITDAAMDGPQSRVFPEAHNRLHAQKAVLAVLMGGM